MHEDERGLIKDLLVTDDYSITYVTFKEGAVRGNHYHKLTTQHDFILKGELLCAYGDGGEKMVVKANDTIIHNPNEKHAYKALKDAEMISVCFGVRKGKDYEKDTYRLSEPLL